MKYRVITLQQAKKELIDIQQYITEELQSPQAAFDFVDDIEAQISKLEHMPKRFALVDDEILASKGVRLIPVKNFLIFYVVDEEAKTVNIVSVMYGKRDWMNLL